MVSPESLPELDVRSLITWVESLGKTYAPALEAFNSVFAAHGHALDSDLQGLVNDVMFIAVLNDDHEVVQVVIERLGGSPYLDNTQVLEGLIPREDHGEVHAALQHGASETPSIVGNGRSMIEYAAKLGHLQTLQRLLKPKREPAFVVRLRKALNLAVQGEHYECATAIQQSIPKYVDA